MFNRTAVSKNIYFSIWFVMLIHYSIDIDPNLFRSHHIFKVRCTFNRSPFVIVLMIFTELFHITPLSYMDTTTF
ncbi:MAG: hypothetical protein COW18_12680 [Zetaproteobacteria bacterium CG12_big_fil_rev_8_21_14_0_65_54_13]|nr:MAG: hypothetical protein COX55_01160 [Zetaproteobacteria bacterium CG23_combo_of_CG06-09_8_20_14_all_54_7]PIW44720.1 MAG: hypothetical protein COW18_12680 [Zetaproteobacteria bacterium CG12_big_fil_rev_8_21_14_0_65_54_13]